MNKSLSEQRLLKKLDIPDWRHMSKDKLIAFANSMSDLDPEVAKAAIAQFPEFTKMGTEIVRIMSGSLNEVIKNEKNVDNQTYEMNRQILNSLNERLHAESISRWEKGRIINAMVQVSNNLAEMDKNHKRMMGDAFKAFGTVIAMVLSFAGAILGVKFLRKR